MQPQGLQMGDLQNDTEKEEVEKDTKQRGRLIIPEKERGRGGGGAERVGGVEEVGIFLVDHVCVPSSVGLRQHN